MKQAPKVHINIFRFLREEINNPIEFRGKLFEEYGDICRKKYFTRTLFYLRNPDHFQEVLKTHEDNYLARSRIPELLLAPFLGKTSLLISSNLERWMQDRLIAKLSFNEKLYFRTYAETVTSLCQQKLSKWEEETKDVKLFNIFYAISDLLLEMIFNTLFTHVEELNAAEVFSLFTESIEVVKTKAMNVLNPLWFFMPERRRHKELSRDVRGLAEKVVRGRLAGNKKWDDILGHFIQQQPGREKEELIRSISDQIITMIIVGFVTTAGLVHWMLVRLAQHPAVEQEICEEIRRVVGSRVPSYEDIPSLSYLACTIRETLRLHPSVHAIPRQSINEGEIAGYRIPKLSPMYLSLSHLHTHPDFWPNPSEFNPLRFMGNPLGQSHLFAYLPFGWGKRNCIGAAFATMDSTLILCMILQRFRITLPPGHCEIKPCLTSPISNRPNVDFMLVERR